MQETKRERGTSMKDKKQMLCIIKISLVIQFVWPVLGLMNLLGVLSVPVELLFGLLTFNMVSAATGIVCFYFYQKVIKEEEACANQKLIKELEKAKRKEEELKQLIEKEQKAVKSFRKVSRKKQRGKKKDNNMLSLGYHVGVTEANEAYPYKEAGQNCAKFISENVDTNSDVNKVLIVDDSITHLKLLSAYIKKMNIESRVAKSGKEAIEAVQREKFALILMDHMMKGKTSLDTVKEIRQLNGEYYEKIPIVDVLSVGMEQYQTMYNTGYYQAYLTKPIAYEILQQVMVTFGVCADV